MTMPIAVCMPVTTRATVVPVTPPAVALLPSMAAMTTVVSSVAVSVTFLGAG